MSNLKKSFKKFFIFAFVVSSLIVSTRNIDSNFNNFLDKKMIKVFDQDTKFQSRMFPISYVYEEEGEETSILDFVTPGPAVFTNTSGTQITLTYNRVLDTNSIPSITDFELAAFTRLGNATGSVISSVRIIGSKIELGITNNIQCSHELTLAYEPGTNKIKDLDGNLAPRVTTSVRNNVELTSVCNESYGGGGSPGGVTPNPPPTIVINQVRVNVNLFLVLTADQISSITPNQIRTISTNLIRKLNPDSATGLTPEQIKAFSPNQIRFMSVNVISVLSPQQIAGLEPNDFRVLTNKQIASISAVAASGMSGADLRVLNPNQLKNLKPNAIANIQPAALKTLSVSKFRNLTKSQKNSINEIQKRSLSPAQITAIKT